MSTEPKKATTSEDDAEDPGRISLELEPLHASQPPEAPSEQKEPPTPIWARIGWALAWVAVGVLLLIALLRFIWPDGMWILLVSNAFTPYIYLPAYVILGISAFGRRWGLNILCIPVIAFHVVQIGPAMLPRTSDPHQDPELKLVTANLYEGNADFDAMIDEIEEHFPDVLFLQEVTPQWRDALERRGLLEEYPHGEVIVREDAFGIALLSKIPLEATETHHWGEVPQLEARLQIEDVVFRLLNIHTVPPVSGAAMERHFAALDATVAWAEQNKDEPFVIAGDFNTTPYNRFSSAISTHTKDGWDITGRGFGFTMPNDQTFMPPIRVDRVLVSEQLTVPEMILGDGPGSDHRLLMARAAPLLRED